MNPKVLRACILSILIVLFRVIMVSSQPIFYNDSQKSTGCLEIQLPKLHQGNGSASGFYINLNARLSERTKFMFEMPYFHFSNDYSGRTYTDGSVGNILLGIKTGAPRGGSYFEGGIRIPTANESESGALIAGSISDITRIEAFFPNYIIAKGLFGYQNPSKHGLTGRFKVGPSLWFYTGHVTGVVGSELILNYSADAWHKGDKVNFGGGISGSTIFTEDALLFPDHKTELLFDMAVSFNIGQVEPGIQIRLLLTDGIKSALDYTLIIGCEVEFNK